MGRSAPRTSEFKTSLTALLLIGSIRWSGIRLRIDDRNPAPRTSPSVSPQAAHMASQAQASAATRALQPNPPVRKVHDPSSENNRGQIYGKHGKKDQ
jgi:hypothetical protein